MIIVGLRPFYLNLCLLEFLSLWPCDLSLVLRVFAEGSFVFVFLPRVFTPLFSCPLNFLPLVWLKSVINKEFREKLPRQEPKFKLHATLYFNLAIIIKGLQRAGIDISHITKK